MSRPRPARWWRRALLATVLAASGFTAAGPGAAQTTPAPADRGCSMPDCFAAISFNPKTGFWVVAKNHPTKKSARNTVDRTCRAQGERDRHCTVLRVVRGEKCVGAAMVVADGAVVEHAAAVGERHRATIRAAGDELDGPEQRRHRIAGTCNG